MGFQKGQKKIAGRKAGAKNKKTLVLDSFAKVVCEGGTDRFQQELNKLKGKDYVNAYLLLFEYVQPKLSRTTVEGGETPLKFVVTRKKKNADSPD